MTIVTTPYFIATRLSEGLLDGTTDLVEKVAPSGAFYRVNRTKTEDGKEVHVTLGLKQPEAQSEAKAVEIVLNQAEGSSHATMRINNLGLGLTEASSPQHTLHAVLIVSAAINSIKTDGYVHFGNLREKLGQWLGTSEDPAVFAPAFAAYRH